MINRFNKMAALLVAATTVASLGATTINASAATKLATQEGTIENAIVFDDGKYIYDGYMTDDDESGLYFNNGSKDSFLEDDEDYDFADTNIKYGTKYAVVENDGDNYLLDLSTGKILDDETIEDTIENLQSKLKSTFNKVDRYEKINKASEVNLTRILEGQFGDVWYSYNVTGTNTISVKGESTTSEAVAAKKEGTIEAVNFNTTIKIAGQTFDGTTANYDQDSLIKAINEAAFGNFKVTAEAADANVKVTVVRVGEDAATATEDLFGDFTGVTSPVFTAGTPSVTTPGEVTKTAEQCYGFVNENGKYIDASVLANITVVNGTKTTKVSEYNDEKDGVTLSLNNITAIAQDKNNIYALAEVKVDIEGSGSTTKTYLQKISKAQGNKEDDAYLPNKVESFEVNGNYFLDGDSDDFKDAAELIKENNEFRVINDTLYVTKVSGKNVEVSTIKLKKNKVTLEKNSSTKYDLYLAALDKQDDQDMQGNDAYSIDSDGNTWILNKGKIYKFNGKDFDEVYSCDRSMDKIDVYNSDNLIVWEEGEDVFAIVGGKTVDNEDDNNTTDNDVTVKTGWTKNSDGTWSFINSDGSKKTGWLNDNGTWYMLKQDGIMATGWYNDRGTWYYLNGSGAMQTGWLNDRGTWYYLNASGAMQTGWLNDNGTWYYLNASGAMQTGWLKDTDGRWYFLQSNGAMAVNTTIDGYVLGANGAWIR